MLRTITQLTATGLLLAVLLFGNGWSPFATGADHRSEASSVAAAPPPTATYVSELGPAVVRRPQHARLPASGAGAAIAGAPWSQIGGAGLALLGAALVHTALTLRPRAG